MDKNKLVKKINLFRNFGLLLSAVAVVLLYLKYVQMSGAVMIMLVATAVLLYANYLASILKKMK